MQEDVTKSMTHEFIEQGEPSTNGEWHAVSLAALIEAGWESISFHYPDDTETPNAVQLHGDAPDSAP